MNASVDGLLERAGRETGLTDFGDSWFMGPLSAYVSDLDGPHLADKYGVPPATH